MSDFSIVGTSVLRFDSLEKVQGKGGYCSDIVLPGMLHMMVLGSPHPHAKILSIDTSRAESCPGVRCVVTDKEDELSPWPSCQVSAQRRQIDLSLTVGSLLIRNEKTGHAKKDRDS